MGTIRTYQERNDAREKKHAWNFAYSALAAIVGTVAGVYAYEHITSSEEIRNGLTAIGGAVGATGLLSAFYNSLGLFSTDGTRTHLNRIAAHNPEQM